MPALPLRSQGSRACEWFNFAGSQGRCKSTVSTSRSQRYTIVPLISNPLRVVVLL
jgi:hypothetical protein